MSKAEGVSPGVCEGRLSVATVHGLSISVIAFTGTDIALVSKL